MKRLTWLICSMLLVHSAWAGMHTYTTESALKSGNIIKIRVSETGVHMIPYDSIAAWGLQPNNVCLLGYGGAMLSENFMLERYDDLPPVSFYMHTGADQQFNSGDYILFYAQGPTQWTIDKNNYWRHTQNPYSHYGYYFVTDKQHLQRKITLSETEFNDNDLEEVDWYMAHYVHEKDLLNLIDVTGTNGGGREFYGEKMNLKNNNLTISFPAQHVRRDINAHCNIHMAAYSGSLTPIQISYAGNKLTKKITPVIGQHMLAVTDSVTIDTKPTSTNEQEITFHFNSTAPSAVAYLNYIELNVPCELVMVGNEMPITNTLLMGQKPAMRYHLKGATAQTQIWRVTEGVFVDQMPTEFNNGILTWIGNNTTPEKYVALNPTTTTWRKPTTIGKVPNQNLHALNNIDYVIICPKDFLAPAERLAKKHEEIDNITYAVVTDEQVYNEFSSGTPDASAYRWLMKMLYDRANGNVVKSPKNLLLMGKGTYDNRRIYSPIVSGANLLLTFQARNSTEETHAYGTDDYFGFLTDHAGVKEGVFREENALMNIGVGRLPVKTLEEANQVVDKICTYIDDQVMGKWKSQVLFLADDGDHSTHLLTAEAGAERFCKKNPEFVVNKIYLDAHTQEVSAAGERYPLAKNQFDNLMTNGVLFMNYSGHGGYNNITNELFMRINDIKRMNNTNQAFWFLATCSFSHFDGGKMSAGEEAVLNPNGGAIGVLSACRTVYATENTILNQNLCDTIFGHKTAFDYPMTLGEATRIAKNQTGNRINKLPYILLGDPAIRLNYPTDYLIRTTSKLDTLHALSIQTIRGYIETPNHDTAHWFNGKLDVTIFDKIQEITTRDNDEIIESEKVKYKYNDYPNILFVGQTDVIEGKFKVTFMVPKDIRYNYGNGRITYYAHDTESHEEAIGYYEDFIIGGSCSVIAQDTIGPELKIYLNNINFSSGGETHEFPHFYAEIYDENGINTAGTGIGHDLVMVIDNEAKQTYVLNSYFLAKNNSYQEGLVSYKMAEQQEGAHTLTFRAWDLHNNSSTASLNFQVVKGLDPQLYSITTYPNPAPSTGVLNILIEHDRPDEIIESTVYLYNLNGQLVHAHTQKGNDLIQWNLGEINTPAGIYVYQAKIKTNTSNFTSKAGKVIITQ